MLLTGSSKNKAEIKWADSCMIVPGRNNNEINTKIGVSELKNFLSSKKSSFKINLEIT